MEWLIILWKSKHWSIHQANLIRKVVSGDFFCHSICFLICKPFELCGLCFRALHWLLCSDFRVQFEKKKNILAIYVKYVHSNFARSNCSKWFYFKLHLRSVWFVPKIWLELWVFYVNFSWAGGRTLSTQIWTTTFHMSLNEWVILV